MNEISNIHNFFKKTIGQEPAINKLIDLWSGHYYDDGHVPPHIVTAPPGLGKTHLIKIVRDISRQVGKTPIFAPSGQELGSRLAFGEFLMKYMEGKPAALIIDEYHESSLGVQNAIRSMIDVESVRRPSEVKFSDDMIFTFDPKIHTVVLGTNRLDLVAAPLRTRLENIELNQYSDDEIEAILVQMLTDCGLEFEYGTLSMIAEANRGNARDIILWGKSIKRRVAQFQRKTVTTDDVYAILKLREILPKGLNKSELAILLALERCGALQKQELAARIGCCSKEVEAHEKYLWRREFVRNDGKRVLTQKGYEYLSYLRNCGFLAEKSE